MKVIDRILYKKVVSQPLLSKLIGSQQGLLFKLKKNVERHEQN